MNRDCGSREEEEEEVMETSCKAKDLILGWVFLLKWIRRASLGIYVDNDLVNLQIWD